MMMTHEEARFMEILLICGFSEGYDAWLNGYLETEDPLSRVIVGLIDCGSNTKQIVSCLHTHYADGAVDDALVCDMLRRYLKEAYDSGRMTRGECTEAMRRFARCQEDPYELPWRNMDVLADYYEMVEDEVADMARFDREVLPYLNEGIPVNSDRFWNGLFEPKDRKPRRQIDIRLIIAAIVLGALICVGAAAWMMIGTR